MTGVEGEYKVVEDRSEQESRKTEKADHVSMIGLYLNRRRPTLPRSFPRSTIGPARLNFRVRDGNGCDPRGNITGKAALSS